MDWKKLDSQEALHRLIQNSHISPQVIFKHSTRCSISFMTLSRIDRGIPNTDYHLVDIISDRELSNQVAEFFHVVHQSPQILIIYKGTCFYNNSHFGISREIVERQLKQIT